MSESSMFVHQAKMAEQAERYDDMVEAMRKLVAICTKDLTVEERNLLSVAYKNVVGARRSAWRVVSSLIQKMADKSPNERIAQDYLTKIGNELTKLCEEVFALLDDTLLVNASVAESKVFYLKMKGDYYRYLVEISQDDDLRDKYKGESKNAYDEASENSATNLPSTHPIRLGLALNFSVFYYEIENDSDKACALAKKAFDDAIAELDNLQEDSYKDSTLIMQLLRDNLTLWTAGGDDAEEDQKEG